MAVAEASAKNGKTEVAEAILVEKEDSVHSVTVEDTTLKTTEV